MSSDRRDDRKRSGGDSRDDRRGGKPHETNRNDAKSIRCRVFVGNLNTEILTRPEFEKAFSEHGKVLGASLHNGFGFVQYEKESEADLAVLKQHGTVLKEKRIDVNLAGDRRKPSADRHELPASGRPGGLNRPRSRSPSLPDRRGPPGYRGRSSDPLPPDPYGLPQDSYPRSDLYPTGPPMDDRSPKRMRSDIDYPPLDTREPLPFVKPAPQGTPIDCEVIIINKQQRAYADAVEKKLKSHGLVVECAHLPETVSLVSELEDASRRGVLYGIIISSQHEVHHSVTVHILHGTQQEHRNMPLEDAIKLVSRNFDMYMQTLRDREREKEKAAAVEPAKGYDGELAGSATAAPLPYSPEISRLLNMAADGKSLTANQYSELINELTKLRDELLQKEGRAPTSMPTDPRSIALEQAELQAKILRILHPTNQTKLTPDATSAPVLEAKPEVKIPVLTPARSASTPFEASSSTAGSVPGNNGSLIGMALSNLLSGGTSQSAPANQVTNTAFYYSNSYPQGSPYIGLPVTNSAQAWPQSPYRVATPAIPTTPPSYGARATGGYAAPAGPNYYQRY